MKKDRIKIAKSIELSKNFITWENMDAARSTINVRFTIGDGKNKWVYREGLEVHISTSDRDQLMEDFPNEETENENIRHRIFAQVKQHLGDVGDQMTLCDFGRLSPIWNDGNITHMACTPSEAYFRPGGQFKIYTGKKEEIN